MRLCVIYMYILCNTAIAGEMIDITGTSPSTVRHAYKGRWGRVGTRCVRQCLHVRHAFGVPKLRRVRTEVLGVCDFACVIYMYICYNTAIAGEMIDITKHSASWAGGVGVGTSVSVNAYMYAVHTGYEISGLGACSRS